MAEYIEREAAFNAILKLVPKVDGDGYCWIIRGDAATAIDNIPAADVAPARHGRWEEDCAGAAVCSACNEYAFETRTHHLCGWFPHYCPNCGARMDGGEP